MELLDQLRKRHAELKDAELQAVHNLGVVTGRLEEIEALIAQLNEPTPTEVEQTS